MLAVFLNVLAHHEKNRLKKVDYVRSGWSVSQAFNECLRVVLINDQCLRIGRKFLARIEQRELFAERPLAATEDILKSQASGLSNDMSLGWPIDVDEEEEDDVGDGPNIATGEAENAYVAPSFTKE
ncbi:hypothetical protein A4A49_10924 [Nicotiana attenuata]|uniref:Uncharacterized protein n=1 Tax=Nicotiana attenuata TaxID=49451 RepID=A0A314KYM2_NICAT|nr:hypothetical protein A4A49_10924 [Nicotiana attenuata]